ncbi:MAG: zf-HC2 domain-containing protein [Myxococcaceae bacterium]
MNALLEDARWQACLSAYRLDRWRLGELPAEEATEVQAHLLGCTQCRAAQELLAAGQSEYLALAAPLRRPPRAGRAVAWGVGAAALAATCLVVLQPGGVRSKGAPTSLGMYVQHQQRVRRALPGETVAPGDVVRFVYSSQQPRYVAVLSLDGAGVASVYFPDGPETVRVEPAEDAPLPLGTRLDGVLGQETVVALFCERPRTLEPVRQALQAAAPALPQLPGCALATFHFRKQAP